MHIRGAVRSKMGLDASEDDVAAAELADGAQARQAIFTDHITDASMSSTREPGPPGSCWCGLWNLPTYLSHAEASEWRNAAGQVRVVHVPQSMWPPHEANSRVFSTKA